MAPDNTAFPERELCRCKGHCKMSPVFGWLQQNCFMNSPGPSSSAHATGNPSDPVEGFTSLSGAGRRKIGKERQAQALSNKTHAIRDCFTPVLRDLCSRDRGKFHFHLIQPLSSPSYEAAGASDTSFKDEYMPRGWSNLYLLHSHSSRSACITDAAVQGVRWNNE